MSRIELGGEGFPIPEEALPDGLVDETLPAVTLVLEEGNFTKADFVGLGYTNYEVWCIGAAGGRGGAASSGIRWLTTKTNEVMPLGMWNDMLAYEEAQANNPPGYRYIVTDPATGDQLSFTYTELRNWQNPTRTIQVTTYHSPFLSETSSPGGGGGGGGLHRVTGLLADLPALVPVSIGQKGDDALPGQELVPGLYNPNPFASMFAPYPAALPSQYYPQYIFTWFAHRYPNVPTLLPPQAGEDGEPSSFGDICEASGGKGGAGALEWIGGVKFFGAYGGQGGSGDRLIAGGGADGSTSSTKSGKDGTWDGVIGKGGGGGRGGRVYQGTPLPDGSLMHHSGGRPSEPIVVTPATNGGQGSFSYGDTSVVGARGLKSNFIGTQHSFDPETGGIRTTLPKPTSYQVMPGGGGGAKAPGKRYHGSISPGYSPDGIVLIKVFKVE